MFGIFVPDQQPLQESDHIQCSRRDRFLDIMCKTRRIPKRRPIPLPNAKLGIFLLSTIGVILSVLGIWYFSVFLDTLVESKIEVARIKSELIEAEDPVKGRDRLLNKERLLLIAATDSLRKADTDGIVIVELALAATIAKFISFLLAIIGTWREKCRLLKISLCGIILSMILEIVAVIKDTSNKKTNLLQGNYSVTLIIFTLLLMIISWIMLWLHHRWLSFSTYRQSKQTHETPLFDNV